MPNYNGWLCWSDPDLSRDEEQLTVFTVADALSCIGCHEEAVKTARRGLQLSPAVSTEIFAEQVAP